MPKSYKFDNENYFDSRGIVHNRQPLNQILDANNKKNTNVVELYLDFVGVNTGGEYQVLNYVIPEDGTYLIVGTVNPNHYGQSGRELSVSLYKNWNPIITITGVCNTYTWTLTMTYCAIKSFKKGHQLEILIRNSDTSKTWSNSGGQVFLVRLNGDS